MSNVRFSSLSLMATWQMKEQISQAIVSCGGRVYGPHNSPGGLVSYVVAPLVCYESLLDSVHKVC